MLEYFFLLLVGAVQGIASIQHPVLRMSILLFFFIFSFVSCTSSFLMTKRDPLKSLPLPPRLNQASSGWHSELLRNGVNKPLATIFIAASLMIEIGVTPARAAIGEGDLPDGALAFQKVTKAQKEWKKFAEATEKRKDEIDDAEVTRIKSYLKQLANEYYDMEVLFYDFSVSFVYDILARVIVVVLAYLTPNFWDVTFIF